jgi:Zn-dependent protease
MRLSWKLGRVAGIDLFLHPTFLLLLAYVAATHQGSLVAVALVSAVFGCVVLHELGHALMARRFGIETVDITLYPIGGVARLQRMPRAPGAELLIALAGPAVNVVLAGGLLGLQALSGAFAPGTPVTLADAFVASLITINLGLALFNLIPAFPMDGGRVLRAALSGWLGRMRATEVAAALGQGLALLFGLYCLANGAFLNAMLAGFIYLAARMELAHVSAEERSRRPSGPDNGIWVAPPGYAWQSRGEGVWQLAPIVVPNPDQHRSWS